MKKVLLLLLLVLSLLAKDNKEIIRGMFPYKKIGYHHSLDIKVGPSISTKERAGTSLGTIGFYNGLINFRNGLYIPGSLRFIANSLPDEERMGSTTAKYTTPISIEGFGGVGWESPKNIIGIRLRGYGKGNINNRELAMPWSISTEDYYRYGYLKENMFLGGDVTLNIVSKPINFSIYSFNRITSQSYRNIAIPALDTNKVFDHNWWIKSSGDIKLIRDKLTVTGNLLSKNDMVTSNEYNLLFARIGLGSNLRIKRKIRLWGEITARSYGSGNMETRGYLNSGGALKNIGFYSHLRSFVALKKELYLKGDFKIDGSNLLLKTRYDIAVKKVWRKRNINSQVGFWSTPGALFPTHCTYYTGSFGIGRNFAIIPEAKFYWEWESKNSSSYYDYNRTDLNLELNYSIPKIETKTFSQMTFVGGVAQQFFLKSTLPYSDNLTLFIGLRTYL